MPCHIIFATFRDLCLHVGHGTIYDNLEHSILKKNAYMWDPTEFFDDLEHSILK
jgi:hypothetical protein